MSRFLTRPCTDIRHRSERGLKEIITARIQFRLALPALAAILATLALSGYATAQQQEQEPTYRIPTKSKIEGGSNRQAFTGKLESVDLKMKLLNVNPIEGEGTEIFPIRKSLQVETADGGKMKLTDLLVGSEIIIYYEQKGGKRTVKKVVLLGSAAEKAKKKKPSSS